MPSSSRKNSPNDPLQDVADDYQQYFKAKKNNKSLLQKTGVSSVINIVKSLIPGNKYEGGSRKTKSKKTTQKRRKHHRRTYKK